MGDSWMVVGLSFSLSSRVSSGAKRLVDGTPVPSVRRVSFATKVWSASMSVLENLGSFVGQADPNRAALMGAIGCYHG